MKVGLALSGGGARGIAHLGVVKALQELGFTFEAFSGVSSGAIAATFLASGYTPDQVLQKLSQLRTYSFLRPNLLSPGLIDASVIQKLLQQHLQVKTFEELNVPLTICAADIKKGKRIYFSKGDLLLPLMATSAVPVMFNAIEHQGDMLVDGGLLNNLPAEPLAGVCSTIIGVHSNMVSSNVRLRSTRHFLERSLQLLLSQNVRYSAMLCDFVIEPPELQQFGVTQFSKAAEIFETGYRYTHQVADKLHSLSS